MVCNTITSASVCRTAVVFEDHQDGRPDPQAGGGEREAGLQV